MIQLKKFITFFIIFIIAYVLSNLTLHYFGLYESNIVRNVHQLICGISAIVYYKFFLNFNFKNMLSGFVVIYILSMVAGLLASLVAYH